MGLLINGAWHDEWYDTKTNDGEFIREDAQFRNWVTRDGMAGQTGEDGFAATSGRYHLYVSLACPWAHRTLIFRTLKDLKKHIDVSVVEPLMLEKGWTFSGSTAQNNGPVKDVRMLHEIYTHAKPDYTGRVTVPVLWDKKRKTIASNESSEIIRMFNSAFNEITGNSLDYYPDELRSEIDSVNAFIYDAINNGVYRTGFATTQRAYEKAFTKLFDALDQINERLTAQRFLCGATLTEADWRLFTTLIRFDAVYVGHFKTNRQRIEDYPALSAYLRDLYQAPGIAETVNFEHIKRHYYASHRTINPTGIVPLGPRLDFDRPHGRDLLAK